jgi:transposase
MATLTALLKYLPPHLRAPLPDALAEPDIPDRSPLHHPWEPMSDAEWAALRPYLPDPTLGGRPTDRRRAWDAVFWVAASREPWRSLPEHLGKPGSAHRTLSRAAAAGLLDRLLAALIAGRPTHDRALAPLAWRVLRCIRRISRRIPLAALLLAKQIGLHAALPVHPRLLPRPGLSTYLAELKRCVPANLGEKAALIMAIGRVGNAMTGASPQRWCIR